MALKNKGEALLDFSKYPCILFDLDGTLLDSTGVWARIDVEFLGRRGIPVTKDYMEEIKTHTFESGSVYTKEKYNLPESTDLIMKEWYDCAQKECSENVKLKPFAYDFLKKLKSDGKKLGIATSSDRLLFEECLKRNGIYDFFDTFTQTNEVEKGKKFPDVYYLAARKCGYTPKDCLVFEDVLSAIKGAKMGGFTVVGIYDMASCDSWNEIKEIADYAYLSYDELM